MTEAKTNNTIDLDVVKKFLHYNPDTGIFTWIHPRRGICVGDRAGRVSPTNGYRDIQLFGQRYLEHRLAWFYHYGVWPEGEIDHKNRMRDQNWIENLREVSASTNQCNSTGRGYYWHKKSGKWHAEIKLHGKKRSLGLHTTEFAARMAYIKAKLEYHELSEFTASELTEELRLLEAKS